jgi:hypothetical protein
MPKLKKKKKVKNLRWTVLMLYPDWLTDGDIQTYLAWVSAPTPAAAIPVAQRKAAVANDFDLEAYDSACEAGESVEYDDPAAFEAIGAFKGHLYLYK